MRAEPEPQHSRPDRGHNTYDSLKIASDPPRKLLPQRQSLVRNPRRRTRGWTGPTALPPLPNGWYPLSGT